MTSTTRAILKTKFGQGDKPSGTDFADLIDSALNLQDTATQSLAGAITAPTGTFTSLNTTTFTPTNLNTTTANITTLSATNANITTISAQNVYADQVITNHAYGQFIMTGGTISLTATTSAALSGVFTTALSTGFKTSGNSITYLGTSAVFMATVISTGTLSSAESTRIHFSINGVDRKIETGYVSALAATQTAYQSNILVELPTSGEVKVVLDSQNTTTLTYTNQITNVVFRRL